MFRPVAKPFCSYSKALPGYGALFLLVSLTTLLVSANTLLTVMAIQRDPLQLEAQAGQVKNTWLVNDAVKAFRTYATTTTNTINVGSTYSGSTTVAQNPDALTGAQTTTSTYTVTVLRKRANWFLVNVAVTTGPTQSNQKFMLYASNASKFKRVSDPLVTGSYTAYSTITSHIFDPVTQAIYLFDTNSSIWGPDEPVVKIDVATDAVSSISLPSGVMNPSAPASIKMGMSKVILVPGASAIYMSQQYAFNPFIKVDLTTQTASKIDTGVAVGSSPITQGDFGALFLSPDGRYLYGLPTNGSTGSGPPVSQIARIDTQTDVLTLFPSTGPFPTNLGRHTDMPAPQVAACQASNGYVYGTSGTSAETVLWVNTNGGSTTWGTLTVTGQRRSAHCIVADNGSLYFIPTHDGTNVLKIDPTTPPGTASLLSPALTLTPTCGIAHWSANWSKPTRSRINGNYYAPPGHAPAQMKDAASCRPGLNTVLVLHTDSDGAGPDTDTVSTITLAAARQFSEFIEAADGNLYAFPVKDQITSMIKLDPDSDGTGPDTDTVTTITDTKTMSGHNYFLGADGHIYGFHDRYNNNLSYPPYYTWEFDPVTANVTRHDTTLGSSGPWAWTSQMYESILNTGTGKAYGVGSRGSVLVVNPMGQSYFGSAVKRY